MKALVAPPEPSPGAASGGRRLRIGLVVYGSLERLTGGNLYDRRLAEEVERRGHRVEIVSLPLTSYGRQLAHNLWRLRRRLLASGGFDLLLQDELVHPSLLRLNRGRLPFPVISVVHHLRSSETEHPRLLAPLHRTVERAYLRSVDGFVYNSRATRGAVASLRATARPPGVLATPGGDRLGPGLEPEAVRRRAREPGPLRLLFVGNLIRRKGLDTLLEALARVPGEACRLEVVGSRDVDPAYAHLLERQAALPPLAGRVRFCGRLSDERLVQRLRTSHLLVVPSSFEGFGIVYLEGLGFGLPAIATQAGSAGEIVEHDRCGLLVPPGDAAALARAIEPLHADRERLARLGLAALERFGQFPTWKETASRIADFLERLARDGWQRSGRGGSAPGPS